jgi:transglutaminase-like putative cysteine protease
MARAAGIPARIAVGLAFVNDAFYYHAWPEVYLDDGRGGYWLPVDPTFNQFPADTTHVRLLRGGLDQQAAILPLIGRLKLTVLDVAFTPDAGSRVVVGREADSPPVVPALPPSDARPVAAPSSGGGCWFSWCEGRR